MFYLILLCSMSCHESVSVSLSVVSDSLWPHGLWPPRLLCSWTSPGKNNGVGSHSHLRRIFWPRDWTQVFHIAGRFFTIWATREVPCHVKCHHHLSTVWQRVNLLDGSIFRIYIYIENMKLDRCLFPCFTGFYQAYTLSMGLHFSCDFVFLSQGFSVIEAYNILLDCDKIVVHFN